MSSFEPVVLIYGSPQIVASANLRLPVSSLFAFDIKSFENIVNAPSKLTNPCLQRYFIILLESIDRDLLLSLHSDHRVISIYEGETILSNSDQDAINRMTNSYQQITLDLTNDIIQFLTVAGQKQLKLERLSLVKIYYQQARVLKEWSMSLFKAEPCHILLISLNSTKANLDNAQQRLEQICTKLGYESIIIRQLNAYIPCNDNHSSLLPYSRLLFNHEDPHYLCEIIKRLCGIRLYLYGNELCCTSEWSKLMIERETSDLMDDEDNWISFIENELIDDEIKWNFAHLFSHQWKTSRVSPIDLDRIGTNPRFQSAVRRAHVTFAQRQIDVTAQIFDWYNKCLERGNLHTEPKLTFIDELLKIQNRPKTVDELMKSYRFERLFSFDYPYHNYRSVKPISFIWLNDILPDSLVEVNESQWKFFACIDICTEYIKRKINSGHFIFLVISDAFGSELFLKTPNLMKQIFAVYIYCTEYFSSTEWTKDYPYIHGVYEDPLKLVRHIRNDYKQLQNSLGFYNPNSSDILTIDYEDIQCSNSLPITVYDVEHAHIFIENQKRIDELISMENTNESKFEMIREFRRIYYGNEIVLIEIDDFDILYESDAAIYWYTRDTFVYRAINQSLRSNNQKQISKFRHILKDIYSHLSQSNSFPEIYYRGQLISNEELSYFKQHQGKTISINTFLSTTTSFQVAFMYTTKSNKDNNLISVIFSIEKHSSIKTRPYSNISHYSLFPDEDETLFSMGTIFRIGNISQLENFNHVLVIQLFLIDQIISSD